MGYIQEKINIYNSIYHMDRYKVANIGDKWCNLCINPLTIGYEILGGVYCLKCMSVE